MASRLTIFGNLLVLGIVGGGGWMVWNNATRDAAPPSAVRGAFSDAAQRVGYDPAARAPRAGALQAQALSIA